jgi:hypothetical protein
MARQILLSRQFGCGTTPQTPLEATQRPVWIAWQDKAAGLLEISLLAPFDTNAVAD